MTTNNPIFAHMISCGPKRADLARELLRSMGSHLAHGRHTLADVDRKTLDDLIYAPHAYTEDDVTAAAKQMFAEKLAES